MKSFLTPSKDEVSDKRSRAPSWALWRTPSPVFRSLFVCLLVHWDACRTGSLHKKPTGFLTNAPWIADLLCDMKERPHVHVTLEGKVADYRPGASQKTVWYTSLAAEYSEGMCNKLATDFQA